MEAMQRAPQLYQLNDLGAQDEVNFKTGIDYSNADALTLSEILKGAVTLTDAERMACLEARKAEEIARRKREQAFADRHPNWERAIAERNRLARIAERAQDMADLEDEIERRILEGRKYIKQQELAKTYRISLASLRGRIVKVQGRILAKMIGDRTMFNI